MLFHFTLNWNYETLSNTVVVSNCSTLFAAFSLQRELYPTLLLFPAENKTSITYEGDMSVVSIIEFLISHGRNSHYLNRHKGI